MPNSSYHLFVKTLITRTRLVVRQKARLVLEEEKEKGITYLFLLQATCIGECLQTGFIGDLWHSKCSVSLWNYRQ